MRQFIAVLILSVSALMPVVAHATPITYTLSTTASGELGGVSFADALVTMTVDSDTADVTSGAGYSSHSQREGNLPHLSETGDRNQVDDTGRPGEVS